MNSIRLRHAASTLVALCVAGLGLASSAGCSGAPEQSKAEPMAVEQPLVCSAFTGGKGSGGDGCGSSSGGSSSGGSSGSVPSCGYGGQACCSSTQGAYCFQGFCFNGTCGVPTLQQVTDDLNPTAGDGAADLVTSGTPATGACSLTGTVAVPPALATMNCSTGSTYYYPNILGLAPTTYWACESFVPTAGYTAISHYTSACLGQPDSGFVMVGNFTVPDGMGGDWRNMIGSMGAGGPCLPRPTP